MKDSGIDLIKNQDWTHLPGATVKENGVLIKPLDIVIMHQDGSAAQPNPPVNTGGPHLQVSGDFEITATMDNAEKGATLRLYGEVPIIYDQWRHEGPSISIEVSSNLIQARIWDGSASSSIDMRSYKFPSTRPVMISLEHSQKEIRIRANNSLLGSIPDHKIFDSGNIWFGADSSSESTGWTLTALNARAIGTGKVELVPTPSFVVDESDPNSLCNLTDTHPRKIKIGAAIAIDPLITDAEYRKLALSQFNILTPENSLKPHFIHPQRNVYVYEKVDQLVDIALANGMSVHGHTLLYDKSTPEWMNESSKEERQKIMLEHIENVVGHFKGRVTEWDVVNEPFSKKRAPYKDGKQGLEPNIWFEAMGENYIDLAFRAAHEADPEAKLYLNDYGLERDGERWDALLSLVVRLKQRGVPIDGVGFEAHVYTDGDYMDAGQLKKHMQILAKNNLLARISEIDVTGDDSPAQIAQYELALDVCLRAINCTSYTTWGVSDRYGSTTRSDRYPLVYGTSLLWDKDMKAKPAYTALQARLMQPD